MFTLIKLVSAKFNFASLANTLEGLSPQDLRSDIAANSQRIENGRVNEIVYEAVTGIAPTDYSKFIASFQNDLSYRYMVRFL